MYQGKVNEPVTFEQDLIALVKNVNFRKVKKKIFPVKASARIKMIDMIKKYDIWEENQGYVQFNQRTI